MYRSRIFLHSSCRQVVWKICRVTELISLVGQPKMPRKTTALPSLLSPSDPNPWVRPPQRGLWFCTHLLWRGVAREFQMVFQREMSPDPRLQNIHIHQEKWFFLGHLVEFPEVVPFLGTLFLAVKILLWCSMSGPAVEGTWNPRQRFLSVAFPESENKLSLQSWFFC